MNAWQFHAEGIAEIQAEAGGDCPVINWAGQDYILLPGSAQLKRRLQEGGYDQEFDFTATALLSTFAANNAQFTSTDALANAMLKTSFTYLGEVYRFQSVWLLSGGFQIQINANSADLARAATAQ
jgi:hypothetical protein